MSRLLSAIVAVALFVAGCASHGTDRRKRSVAPDLISESGGDEGRFYLPDNPPRDEWPRASRTEFYLAQRKRVYYRPGEPPLTDPLDEEAAEIVRGLVEQLHAAREPNRSVRTSATRPSKGLAGSRSYAPRWKPKARP
jgi:hypothetical protein